MKALDCIVVETANEVDACVIWLHGLGADGNDFVPVVDQLLPPALPPIRFLFPNAPIRPISINQGYEMRGWYDVRSMNVVGEEDAEGIQQSSDAIDGLIQQQLELGIDAHRIILAGFSQGGAVALHCGLRRAAARLGGIMSLSSYLPQCAELNATRELPLFLAHGSEDNVVNIAFGQQAFSRCNAAGYDPVWHEYPMAHSVCMEEIRDIQHWLSAVLGTDRID